MVYADNAATTKLDKDAFAAMLPWLQDEYGNVDFIRNGSVSKSPGIISVSIRNISGEMLLHRLDLKGISISTGSACDSVNTQVSHVIKAIGVPSA